MAKFLATNAAGADSGASSDVEQFVDLSAYAAEIAIGNLSVEMNARFNRVAGANSDTQFVVLLAARDGTIDNGNDLWASVEMLLADADPATWESLATSVPLPFGTTHLSVRVIAGENMVNNTVAPEFDGHYVDDVTLTVTIPPPDIQVEAPQGNIVTSGVPGVQFGLRQVGSGPDAGIRHRLTNTGLRPLTGIVATVTGHSADFLVAPPPATLGVGQSTEFDVVFTPTAAGARAATLSIASNDPDESPFLVLLAGTGLTVQEAWRQQYFGTVANAGNAADSADPDGDGHDNAFEFVAGLVPNDPASRFLLRVEPVAGQLGQKAIIFGPVVAGRTYGVKSKESLSDPEWTTLTNIAMSDNGSERTIADLEAGLGPKFYVIEITRP